MIKKNCDTPRSRTRSKCESKKVVTNISFSLILKCIDFLIILLVFLLEFEQTLKDFLDLEIYKAFIKLFDQTKRKTKKI